MVYFTAFFIMNGNFIRPEPDKRQEKRVFSVPDARLSGKNGTAPIVCKNRVKKKGNGRRRSGSGG